MGCDIHCYIEKREFDDWVFFGELSLSRNYNIFCKLAGVRCYEDDGKEPLAANRGLPKDASGWVTGESTDPDWHSHSWCTPDEWDQAIEKLDDPDYVAVSVLLRNLEKTTGNARVVFWFDN